ncbi:hypothetical protein BJ508DRAFT_307610 [Ascobolus immersus RN42]|uniref:Uncharacterized protein n=1 Tax=Ascobolus immersus RN42 TaxID=1160509 RepID=A0A3N4I2A0_ASCIM|nr:hypothetical protein BJ508DRAFT_307610 [Ascobolus immersus RN42]
MEEKQWHADVQKRWAANSPKSIPVKRFSKALKPNLESFKVFSVMQVGGFWRSGLDGSPIGGVSTAEAKAESLRKQKEAEQAYRKRWNERMRIDHAPSRYMHTYVCTGRDQPFDARVIERKLAYLSSQMDELSVKMDRLIMDTGKPRGEVRPPGTLIRSGELLGDLSFLKLNL